MNDREKFMFEIWKTAMQHRKDAHGTIRDYEFIWSCVRQFWLPTLSPIADKAGY